MNQNVEEASFIVAENNNNHPGKVTEVIRVFLVIIPIVFTSILAVSLTSKLCQRNSFKEFVIQLLVICVPLVLSVTVGVETVCNLISPVLIWTFIGFSLYFFRKWKNSRSFKKFRVCLDERPQSVTGLRSTINIMTACAILACDFEIFPHDFLKSRTYGVGLMDTGIGLFVFSMAIVSKPVKNAKDLKRMLIQVGPLLILGLIRTVVIRTIDYHQDEREYGRDFNAFITLGITKLIGGLITMFVPVGIPLLTTGVVVAGLHELTLHRGLAAYCLSETVPRISFFEANREGIVSVAGFVSIYLISLHIGLLVRNAKESRIMEFKAILWKIVYISVVTWWLTLVCIYTTGISRRIANFGYVSWVLSLATSILIIFLVIFEVILQVVNKYIGKCLPVLFDIINFNGLVYFLVANVLTGAVNLFLNPSQRSPLESILILIVYMTIPCILNRYLYVNNIRIC